MKVQSSSARGFFRFDRNLFTHGGENNNISVLLLCSEETINLIADFALWDLDIILSIAVVRHQGQKAVAGDIKELIFLAGHVGDVHVVSRGTEIFQLLASEDIDSDKMDFSVTVLSGLGGAHFDNLAWAVLDDNEAVLTEGRALHRIGSRSAGIGTLEGVLMLSVVSHDKRLKVADTIGRAVSEESYVGSIGGEMEELF